MKIAAVLVHYHTPQLARRAVAAVGAELERSGLAGEIVLVDNGSDEAGRRLLAGLPARLVEPGDNLGYAGGVNLGVRESSGEIVLILNPDVELLPGCLPALAGALDAGAWVAGPRFYLDSGRRLLLPPSEPRSRGWEILARLARRGGAWARWARRRWRRHARRHWRTTSPLSSLSLSGALLAFPRTVWERVGPFDERFFLYFEETDWLRRLGRQGGRGCYVPAAEVVHHYNQSAGREPRARGWFAESARRFAELHYGAGFARLLVRLESREPGPAPPAHELPPGPPVLDLGSPGRRIEGSLWIELADSPWGFPAAAERLSPGGHPDWQLPREVWEGLAPGRYHLRAVDERGLEHGCWAFETHAHPGSPGSRPVGPLPPLRG